MVSQRMAIRVLAVLGTAVALTASGVGVTALLRADATDEPTGPPAPGLEGAVLPDCIDVPAGPGVEGAPGGAGLPAMQGAAPPQAPAIAAAGDPTAAGQTLVCAGADLEGASLWVWAEGGCAAVQPLRTAADRLVAILPPSTPTSALLIWPVGAGTVGAPIRINGATLWWGWPARLTAEQTGEPQTVRLMGRNLKLEGVEPQVWLQGSEAARELTVTAAHPYQLQAELPTDLEPGPYRLWAHNGTGGRYGWSEPMTLAIGAAPSTRGLPVYRVSEFGAQPDDDRDDADAIQEAVDRAAAAGGVVRFEPGTYHVGRTIETPAEPRAGVHLEGAGLGQYDPQAHAFAGEYTAIRPVPDEHSLGAILRITARGSSVSGLNLLNGTRGHSAGAHDPDDGSRQVTVRAQAHDLAFRSVRFVLLDERVPEGVYPRIRTNLFEPALHVLAPGVANIRIEDCEFHSAGSGLGIGTMPRDHFDAGTPEPSTDYVRVANCLFRGYSIGIDLGITAPRLWERSGIFNDGITNLNGKNLLVEDCDFAGADRFGALAMNRTILNYNTSIRQQYYANNRSHNIGMPSPPGTDFAINQGEQYLFHFRYPRGGFFDVAEADADSVTLDEAPAPPPANGSAEEVALRADGTRAGSRILEEVGQNDHWIVFVTAGRGVGQYRVVVGANRSPGRAELQVERPWRVIPDPTSRVVLTTAFRQNILHGNTVDGGENDPRSKRVGILFWMNAVDNIVADNRLRNLGYGVGFNGMVRNPCLWNVVSGNVMENMQGPVGASSVGPACYVEQFKVYTDQNPALVEGSEVRGWYSVGNLVRDNEGRGAAVGAYVHAALQVGGTEGRIGYGDLRPDPDGGMVLEVVEGNRFTEVAEGVVVNPVVTWAAIRDNVVHGPQGSLPQIADQAGGLSLPAILTDEP